MAEPEGKQDVDARCPAYTGNRPFIMISYAFHDRAIVFPELQRLHALGFRLWYDGGISLGETWVQHVQKAVEFGGCFLLFMSNHAIQSPNVRDEIEFGRTHINQLFVVHIERTDLPQGEELRLSRFVKILKYDRPEEEYFQEIEKKIPPEYKRVPFEDDIIDGPSHPPDEPRQDWIYETLLSSVSKAIPLAEETRELAEDYRKQNRMYRYLSCGSCWFVILLGILQVFFLSAVPYWLLPLELVAVLVAAGSVYLGISRDSYNQWVTERVRAEHYQFLRFRQFIAPIPAGEFSQRLESVGKMTREQMKEWMYGVNASFLGSRPLSSGNRAFSPQVTCRILRYYCENRIQEALEATPEESAISETRIKIIFMLPTLIFLGFILVSLPYLLDFFSVSSRNEAITLGVTYVGYCILFVIVYASAWATIRGFFTDEESALKELSTIKRRHEFLVKTRRELSHQNTALCKQTVAHGAAALQVIQTIYHCEDSLENDCRSWLRNKSKRRWFG
jgi:hypothetical protein